MWDSWEESKPFKVGKFDKTTWKTEVFCKECGEAYTIPGELTPEKKKEGGKEWQDINKHSNTYAKRHKCSHETDEYPVPQTVSYTSKPIREWQAEKLRDYFQCTPEDPPTLFAIEEYIPNSSGKGADLICIFEEKGTGILSNPLRMPSTLIYWAYTDVYPDKIADLNEQKRRRQVWDSCQDILGDIIYTVMKRQEHKKEQTQRIYANRIFGVSRLVGQRDSKYVYNSLMTLFKRYPVGPVLISREAVGDLLNATFYGDPKIHEMSGWYWTNGNKFGYTGSKASLLFKPNALHSWLLLARQQIDNSPSAHLVVDDGQTDYSDPYGFTGRPLPLRFTKTGVSGVVCAVLCVGNQDPTIVNDRNLVLPVALLG